MKLQKQDKRRLALYNLRWRLGLSQDEASQLIGTTGQLIGQWEAGRWGQMPTSFGKLDAYCKALAALAAERGIAGDYRIEALCPDLFEAVAA